MARLLPGAQIALVLGLALVAAGASPPPGGRWEQVYAPIGGSLTASAAVALVPVVLLFALLGGARKPASVASLAALIVALVLAVGVWKTPGRVAASATLLGMAIALMPLLWTLVNAVWLVNLLSASGHFTILRESLGYLTRDRRMQTLVIGYGFTGLTEGLVAIGSPVAIGTAMMVGFGFPAFTAALVALIGFSHPGVWGPMGLPVVVLHSVSSGLDLDRLGALIGRQVPLLTLLAAPVTVVLVSGWRGFRDVWPITLGNGLVFATVTGLVANYVSFYIAGVAGALAAIALTTMVLARWQPRTLWLFPGERAAEPAAGGPRRGARAMLAAWSPIGLLVVLMALVNGTALREVLGGLSTVRVEWPGLHDVVWQTAPVATPDAPYAAAFSSPLLVVPGTVALVTALLGMSLLRIPGTLALRVYGQTLVQLKPAIITTLNILGLGYLMNYAGLSLTLAVAFAGAGLWFPLVAVGLGLIGTAIAGTNTAGNALFGNLVAVGGAHAGVSPEFAAATLASGGSMGKAIAPGSLALATAAGGIAGREGDLFRRLAGVCVAMTAVFSAYVMLQYWLMP